METKSEAFHRLASRRVEGLEDALRILGHLASPSYEWTPNEVRAYFARLDAARDAALARFQETKRWRSTEPVAPDATPEPEPEPEEDAPVRAAPRARVLPIGQIIREAGNCRETLAEMIALQRVVIDDLQAKIERTV